jgi:thymidylate synthase (FAD)
LVRHRAGFGYSQLSQRYVDESVADFVEPACIADDGELHEVWRASIEQSQEAYVRLVEGLERVFASEPDTTLRRKLARQAARSVLPNATETKIFVTANTRALRHFIELRANEHADVEIRAVAIRMLELAAKAAPNLLGDYDIRELPDGTRVAHTAYRKV